MLTLEGSAEEAMVRHAQSGYPHEICGLLVGHVTGDGSDRRVLEARPAANLNQERPGDRYEMNPSDYVRIEREARSQDLEIVGVYHSHPNHPAIPSETDRRRAWDLWQDSESWSYLILEVTSGAVASRRSWILRNGIFLEEAILSPPSAA